MDKRLPTKKSVNLLLDVKLIKQAKESDINLSATLDKALRREILLKWRADSAAAFEEKRKQIEAEGLWSDGLRLI